MQSTELTVAHCQASPLLRYSHHCVQPDRADLVRRKTVIDRTLPGSLRSGSPELP